MRLLLLVPLAVAALAGCSYSDCDGLAPPRAFAGAEVRVDAAPAPDTLVVAFVSAGFDEVHTPSVRPDASVAGELRLVLAGDERQPRPALPVFEAAARGDTVFVRRPLVQAACDPVPEGLALHVTRVEAPAGVRHVRVVVVPADSVSFPAGRAVRARPLPWQRPALLTA